MWKKESQNDKTREKKKKEGNVFIPIQISIAAAYSKQLILFAKIC